MKSPRSSCWLLTRAGMGEEAGRLVAGVLHPAWHPLEADSLYSADFPGDCGDGLVSPGRPHTVMGQFHQAAGL